MVVLQKEQVRDGEVGLSMISGVVVFLLRVLFLVYIYVRNAALDFFLFFPFF